MGIHFIRCCLPFQYSKTHETLIGQDSCLKLRINFPCIKCDDLCKEKEPTKLIEGRRRRRRRRRQQQQQLSLEQEVFLYIAN